MTTDLLGVSVTGLRVSQAKLSTTGRNIANAGVEGYSRQRVDLETNPATLSGAGYIGNGVSVASIERIANSFVIEQLRTDTALFKDLEVYNDSIAQLDRLLSDASTGLSSGLESFFSAMQNGADDPTSIPARQLILSEADNLADRFNTINQRFESIEAGVDEAMTSAVAQINALVNNIAELNGKISDAMGLGNGAQPNDLLDQRDEALRRLSELVSVQTYDQGFGQINVVVGSGQNLVVGRDARQFQLVPSNEDPTKFDVNITNGVVSESITNLIRGGQLGGLIRFEKDVMTEAYNKLGRIAIVMADTFNQTHQQGLTLNNRFGENFFYEVNEPDIAADRVIGNSSNPPPNDRVMRLNIVDSSALPASNYEVTISSGGLFQIERQSDAQVVAQGLVPGSFPFSVNFDGMELVFDSGTYQNGDRFKLAPFATGARDFASALVNPSDIAFASPLLTDAAIGNVGTAEISAGQVLSLNDNFGNALSLFASAGQMDPPLIVRFTSPTTYDVLDNSDPGNPVQLDPPLRDQNYVPGITNSLFPADPGQTLISTYGELIGLPEGKRAVTQASLQVSGATATDFSITDFSGADSFSFDVSISNTVNGVNDATRTITISDSLINNNTTLLQSINLQLSGTDARAYIDDNGAVAFRLNSPGYGDLSLDNYAGPASPAAADGLLGFAISTLASGANSLTTAGDVDGISGNGTLTNGYPSEVLAISRPSLTPGAAPITENIFTVPNASARETAELLSSVAGIDANAFNYVALSDYQISRSAPLQVALNGEALLQYGVDPISGEPVLADIVPDPVSEPDLFNDYLAEQINSNSAFTSAGISAIAGRNAISGEPELRIYSSQGDDLRIDLTAATGESIGVSDGDNPYLTLDGAGNSVASSINVGGRMDIRLADGITMRTFPPQSMLFGDSTASDFAKSTYLGIQASITGQPQTGDTFTLDFNLNAASDNRNALNMVNLARSNTIAGGTESYSESYASLVEVIGIDASSSKINRDASEQVLEQTEALRNSVSGVNLDEEAADLIRYEQMFSANAQVISVARDLFDRLISSF